MKKALAEIDRLRQQLAAVEARAAEAGDRAEGLEVMLENCRAQKERTRKLLDERSDGICEEIDLRVKAESRAEAAEAALADARRWAAVWKREAKWWYTAVGTHTVDERRLFQVRPTLLILRRVAEAARESRYHFGSDELDDALAAWDAARGEGGENEFATSAKELAAD